MRSLIIASVLLSQVASAQASCRVFIPVKEFNNSGYTINFDFTKMLYDKNYQEVYSAEEADYELKLQGTEQEGRFHRAVAVMEMGAYKAEESIVCYTQNCGISDYGKAFNKAYKKLSAIIPHCQ
jgi:hypothetical protein